MQAVRPSAEHSEAPVVTSDVLVCGGGIAGLAVADWLLERQPHLNVQVVEALPRLGGRLNTAFLEVAGQEVKAEQGGMRFMKKHALLMALIHELGLGDQIMPFRMGDDHNFFYVRGRRFTRGQLAASGNSEWQQAYNLAPSEANASPEELLIRVLHAIFRQNGVDPADAPRTSQQWQDFRNTAHFDDVALSNWGLWALLGAAGLSEEATAMIFDSGGFRSPRDHDVNAGSAFQLFNNFFGSADFMTLRGGYEALVGRLADSARRRGTRLASGVSVESFERTSTGFRVFGREREAVRTFETRSLVLACPRIALRELAANTPMLGENRQFLSDVNSVCTMPLMKINLFYRERWWTKRHGITSGGCFTDLPLGQVYCFEPHREEQNHSSPGALTIYCDEARWMYWVGLQKNSASYASPEFPTPPPALRGASRTVVAYAQEQLKVMYGGEALPAPVLAIVSEWGRKAVGDGDHLWSIGSDDREIVPRMIKPMDGLYLAGETYSDEQCWVEGALRSAKAVVARLTDDLATSPGALAAPRPRTG
jgi:lysine 2-monooxygenase